MALLAEIARRYPTDKSQNVHYLASYEAQFAPLRDREVRLLELGIKEGGSLFLWRDYFPNGIIVGLDIEPVSLEDGSGRIRTYQGAQQDIAFLSRIARETAPEGFDIIIDDASHVGALTRVAFWHLFEHHLKPGGVYVIEDWGTGYWENWVDGTAYRRAPSGYSPGLYLATRAIGKLRRNPAIRRFSALDWPLRLAKRGVIRLQHPGHLSGMVGFVKELVDECGRGDITMPGWGRGPQEKSRIRELRISLGHALIIKT